jgi:hypothetical protein
MSSSRINPIEREQRWALADRRLADARREAPASVAEVRRLLLALLERPAEARTLLAVLLAAAGQGGDDAAV